MEIISINCPACGGIYGGKLTSRFVTCEYCGTRFALSEPELRAMGFTDADDDGYDDEEYEEYDDNSDPMDVFAEEACANFLDDYLDDQSSFVSGRKIERGLDIDGDEEIYLIHDDTIFKSGKNGFAITSAGIYCRELSEKSPHFVSWEDFANDREPRLDDNYIRQGTTSLVYFTDNDEVLEYGLMGLIEELYDHAQQVLG